MKRCTTSPFPAFAARSSPSHSPHLDLRFLPLQTSLCENVFTETTTKAPLQCRPRLYRVRPFRCATHSTPNNTPSSLRTSHSNRSNREGGSLDNSHHNNPAQSIQFASRGPSLPNQSFSRNGTSLLLPPQGSSLDPSLRISGLHCKRLTVPLISPFAIATSTITHAENVAVRVTLSDGSQGFGEVPVLPGVTVLDQHQVLQLLNGHVSPWLTSRVPPSEQYNGCLTSENGAEEASESPFWRLVFELRTLEHRVLPGHQFAAVRAGVEMAVLDALCHSAGVPLWRLFSHHKHKHHVETDITIPLCSPEEAYSLAWQYRERGFRGIKLKTGRKTQATHSQQSQNSHARQEGGVLPALALGMGCSQEVREDVVEEDCARVGAVFAAHPLCTLLLDANEGYSEGETVELLRRLMDAFNTSKCMPAYLEQPVGRQNTEAMKRLCVQQEDLTPVLPAGLVPPCTPGVRVVADEGCRSAEEAEAIVREGSAHVINIKLAKLGVLGALDAIAAVQANWQGSESLTEKNGGRVGLMIGGMVETRAGMGFAAHLAAGLGCFCVTDLDTPLLLREDPVVGGYTMRGPHVEISDEAGMGCSVPW